MNEPIVFKRSVLVGQLVLIQVLVPPLVAIGVLFGLSRLYQVKFDGEIRVLAVLVAILAPLVLKRPQISSLTIVPRWSAIAFASITRWLILLALLFAIGYATKTSEEFSRRLVLTWAVVTPAPLILVSIFCTKSFADLCLRQTTCGLQSWLATTTSAKSCSSA
jgi:hypothetical protein